MNNSTKKDQTLKIYLHFFNGMGVKDIEEQIEFNKSEQYLTITQSLTSRIRTK